MNPTLRFALWLTAALCFALAACLIPDKVGKLLPLGLLAAAVVFLIDAAQALN